MYFVRYFFFILPIFVNSLEYIYLNKGNKQGVRSCPDQVIPDNDHGEPHDAKIDSYNVDSICTENSRCCYRKHCPNGICIRFCLYRPLDKYYGNDECPPFTNGIDLWYVPGTDLITPDVTEAPKVSTSSPIQKNCCVENCIVSSSSNCN